MAVSLQEFVAIFISALYNLCKTYLGNRPFRYVHINNSEIKKKCGFITRELTYPQIENPRDENEKFWNKLISKKASDELENPTGCENNCVHIDAKITVRFINKHLISYKSEQSWDAQGAVHGYTNIASFNWLLETKRELQTSDLFNDRKDWRNKLVELVYKKLKEDEIADRTTYVIGQSQLTDIVTSPYQWVILKDGLGIQFGEYELGGRAAPLIKIDWKAIDPYLSKNGHSLIYD